MYTTCIHLYNKPIFTPKYMNSYMNSYMALIGNGAPIGGRMWV